MEEIKKIIYAEELITITHYNGKWQYFISDKDLWILDQKSWANSFRVAGYNIPVNDYSDRFNIPLLDENTVDNFLFNMKKFKVSSKTLSQLIINRNLDEEPQYLPALYVDFDNKILIIKK